MSRLVTLGADVAVSAQSAAGAATAVRDAVALDRVTLAYGEVIALDRVTARFPAGSITVVMGPNGAGKSSLLAVAAGLVRPTSGSVVVAGRSTERAGASRELGVLSHDSMLYDGLTGRENLALHARLRGLPASRVEAVIEQGGLNGVSDRLVGTVSHGIRRRLSLARALLHDPPVLLLDEPFTGLDPGAQDHLSALLDEVRGVKTVLFSTHDLDRALDHADRVLLLERGRLVSEQQQRSSPADRGPTLRLDHDPAASSRLSIDPPVDGDGHEGALAGRPSGVLRTARAVLRKDLLVEARTRSASSAVLVLSALLATVLAMALEPLAGSPRAVSGILWVLVVFAALHGLARSFDEDFRDGSLQGLLLTGVDPAGVYLGRVASTSLFLLAISVAAVGAVAVLFAAAPLLQVFPGLAVVMALAVIGLAAVGAILTVLARHSRLGETLLPLLFLPLAIPVLLAGVESVTALLETGAIDAGWLRVLGFYVIGMIAASMMVFEQAVEG